MSAMVTNGQKITMLSRWLGVPDCNDGVNASFRCPLCKDSKRDKKKLVVRLTDGFYHCWVCEVSGRSFRTLLTKVAPQALTDPKMQDLLGTCKREKKETTWDGLRQKIAKINSNITPYVPPVNNGRWNTDTSIFDE